MRNPILGLRVVTIFLAFIFASSSSNAQAPGKSVGGSPVSRIAGAIDDSRLVKLTGNTSPLLRSGTDLGVAPGDLRLVHMLLVLKRSPEQETALKKLMSEQNDISSPQFHRWLTPEEFGAQFGPAQTDVDKITGWLRSHGFTVAGVSKGRSAIDFSGTHSQVQQAFHLKLRRYAVGGEQHLANPSDPEIPAALAPVVIGVNSLNDFRKKPTSHVIRKFPGLQQGSGIAPNFNSGSEHFVSPGDFWTIYNATPTIVAGTTGAGITIGIVGRSDISANDISAFRSTYLGGSSYTGTFQQIINGPDPGTVSGDDLENTLDVEWASALAPDATVKLVVSKSGAADGVDLSAQYLVDNNLADVISASYGLCESFLGNAENEFLSNLWSQAAAQGITVVVSSGDNGSAGCDLPSATGDPSSPKAAHYGLQVNGLASTPHNVAVGGTQYYNEASSWNPVAGSNPLFGTSALGYIPEQIWNESCGADECGANANLWAASGGASSCVRSTVPWYDVTGCASGWPKPEWQQNVLGIPDDGARSLPDVSFTAAGHDGYLVGFQGDLYSVGGTSCSTPSFAGVMALVNQKARGRQGQANYILYKLAGSEYGDTNNANSANLAACNASAQPGTGNSCVFYDVTAAKNAVPCAAGTPNCSASTPGTYGVVSGYDATPGYDLASGLGSINITNLVQAWDALIPHGTSPTTTILQLNPTGGIIHGAPVSIAVSVQPTSGSGIPTGSVSIVANGNAIALLTLTNGTYAGTIPNLPGGQYGVVARYLGDKTYSGSTSAPVNITVGRENSVTTVSVIARNARTGASVANNAIPYGSNVILHGSVAGASGNGTPTGNITLLLPGAGYGVLLDSSGQGGYGSSRFTPGAYSLSGTYGGDESFNGSTSTTSANFTVVKAGTVVSVSPGNSVGGTIPVTANVITDGYGNPPSGSVNFFVNGTVAGSVTVSAGYTEGLASSTATINLTGAMLNPGANTVTAQYTGDLVYDGSPVSMPISVTVNKVYVTNPAMPVVRVSAPELKPGTAIPVFATVYGTYQNLRIEWASGVNPTSGWSSSGVAMSGTIPTTVVNTQIGTWTPTALSPADYYTIRVSVDDAGTTSTSTGLVYLEPDLVSTSWPKLMPGRVFAYSGFVPTVGAAGDTRLVVSTSSDGTVSSQLRSFSADGSSETSMVLPYGSMHQPAAGEFDGGPGDEIVMPDKSSMYVFRPDGSSYSLSAQVPGAEVYFANQQVVLDDVDGDSLQEVVSVGSGLNGGYWSGTGYVFAWRNNGHQLNSNFPIAIKDQNAEAASFSVPRVLVGDVDGDGAKEFVVVEGTTASTFSTRLFGADGSPRTWTAPTINGYPVQMLLADLDHNGKLETIVFTYDAYLHVLQPNGSERPGWPQKLRFSGWGSSLSVADLNKDGREEIVVSQIDLQIFNSDGSTFSNAWPKIVNWGGYGPTVIADVNGDGYPEIVTTFSKLVLTPGLPTYSEAQLIILDHNGTTLKSWNLLGSDGQQPGRDTLPTIGDFDGDGLTEIAVTYGVFPTEGGSADRRLAMILTTGAPFNAAANDWPMLYKNPRNTAVLRRVADSRVTFASSANPAASYQPLNFTIVAESAANGGGLPTGVVNLLDGAQNIGSCVLSSGTCTIASALPAGAHNLKAGYVGDSKFTNSLSAAITQNVTQSSTTLSLTSNANPSVLGQNVTLAASVAVTAPGGGTPTGSVTFYEGTNTLGSGNLNTAGQSSLQVSNFTVGSHNITATYAGDSNYVASNTASAIAQTVNNPSVTVSVTGAQTVSAGQSARYTITLTPSPVPYNFALSGFSCSGLPDKTTCTFAPTTVIPGNNPATVDLSISTTAPSRAMAKPDANERYFATTSVGMLSIAMLGIVLTPVKRNRKVELACMALMLCLLFISCGGSGVQTTPIPGTPPGTYNITVTGTGNGTNYTTAISLVVR